MKILFAIKNREGEYLAAQGRFWTKNLHEAWLTDVKPNRDIFGFEQIVKLTVTEEVVEKKTDTIK